MARTIGEGINEGLGYLREGQKVRRLGQQDTLDQALKARKLLAFGEEPPEGFVRLPDGSFVQPRAKETDLDKQEQEAKIRALVSLAEKRGRMTESEAMAAILSDLDSTDDVIGASLNSAGSGQRQSLSFNSVEEAIAAGLPPGTKITINGRPAITE